MEYKLLSSTVLSEFTVLNKILKKNIYVDEEDEEIDRAKDP